MSQYKGGTVNVTNGSAAVVGVGTLFLANAAAGNLFSLAASGVPYDVASITDDTHLTLASNYGGLTATGQQYAITTSFTPLRNLPYPEQGDIDTATIIKRAMTRLDSLLGVKYKGTDLSITSNTTLANDADLLLPIAAGEIWIAEAMLDLGAALSTTGIKMAVTVPSGATLSFKGFVGSTAGNAVKRTTTSGTALDFTAANLVSTSEWLGRALIYVANGSTAGNIQLQFAQSTSSGTALLVRTGSTLSGRRAA